MNTNTQNKGSKDAPSTGFLRNLSIKKKLILIIMLVSSVELLLAGASFITYEWFSLRKRMINDLNTHSEMIAANCTGSLSFDDPQDAEEVLESLRYKHPIEYACVYRSDGALFASYKRQDVNTILSSGPQQDGYRIEDGCLVLFKQITLNNKPIGTLYLQSDLSLISRFLKESIIALAIMIFLSSIVAYLLASRLQKFVSTPIFYLAKIAGIVTQKGDYSVRAIKHSKDELGVLTDAFNNMLIQVEKREQSLRESEEKYRSLFGAAVDAIFILKVTEEGIPDIIDCNEYTLKIFECSREEIIGKSIEDFSPSVQPDGRLSHEVIFEASKAVLDGNSQFIEWTHCKLDGTLFDAEVKVNRIDIGKEIYLQAIVRDVTERKKAEEALLESEETARALLNATTDSVLLIDRDGIIIGLNDNMVGSLGRASEDLIGTNVYDYLPVDIVEHRKAKGLEAASSRKPVHFEDQRGDRWLENSVFPVYNSSGEIARYAIYSSDITERKWTEEALHESEKKYRTLFEGSADAVLIIEGDKFVDCNSATVKMLGYKNKKELLNTHPSQLSPPLQPDGQDSFEKANQMMAMAFDQGSNRFEWDHQRKNGEVFPVEVLLTSIPFKEGNFLHVVWRDITERKLAESEIENYRKHLETLVNERTKELEEVHAELVRKERLAALGELIATVSHEIRNPLGTVRNAVYSIGESMRQNKTDLFDRALKLAERNITRCNRIINELLDYTRKREIKLVRTEIDSWLNEVLNEQEFPEEIECVRELHSGIVLQIDREYMRRVIFNVITNAIQALQEEDSKGNRITVESVKSGEQLELRFIDTGPGIPDEIREKIFEPLFSTKSFGVGLGVPIVKNIMEEHQGEVKFQSEADKGTVVTLTLPIHKLEKKR